MPMRQVSRRPSTPYTRRSFFVDEEAIRRARLVLGVRTNAEAVRLAVERVVLSELRRGTRTRAAERTVARWV